MTSMGTRSSSEASLSSGCSVEKDVDTFLTGMAVAALDEAPLDEAQQEVGLRVVLRQLEAPQDNTDLFLQNCVEDRVLSALERHDGEALHLAGAQVINNLCDDMKSRFILTEKSAAKTLMRSLEAHAENSPAVAANVCEALCKLGSLSPDVVQEILSGGGISHTLSAMEASAEVAELQAATCSLLSNLAVLNEARDQLVKTDICDLIVRALELHDSECSVNVAMPAVTLLANLAVDSRFRVRLLKNGALKSLSSVMMNHSENAPVIRSAAYAIASLAENRAYQRVLVNSGFDSALSRALQTFSDSPEVLEACIIALHNLAADTRNRISMVEECCIDNAIIDIMQKHQEEPTLLEYAARLLSNLAMNRDNRVLLVEKHAVDCLLLAKAQHGENQTLASAVGMALERLEDCPFASRACSC